MIKTALYSLVSCRSVEPIAKTFWITLARFGCVSPFGFKAGLFMNARRVRSISGISRFWTDHCSFSVFSHLWQAD